jgi:hypothetical protein
MVVRGVSNVLADMDDLAVHDGKRGSVYQTIDEGCVRVLKDLLDRTAELIGWLRPVVILHGDNEDGLDFLCAGMRSAE